MLVRFKKAVSVRSVGSKINQRSYASLPRGAGGKNLFPNTPVLNKVLSDTGAQKTLAESYADAVASQKKLRDDLLREVNTIFGSSPYASVRSAAGELTGAIAQLDSALPANLAEASFRADNLDELLQVHEVSELYSAYAKAFAQLTPPENKTVNPKVIAEEFAPAVRFKLCSFSFNFSPSMSSNTPDYPTYTHYRYFYSLKPPFLPRSTRAQFEKTTIERCTSIFLFILTSRKNLIFIPPPQPLCLHLDQLFYAQISYATL